MARRHAAPITHRLHAAAPVPEAARGSRLLAARAAYRGSAEQPEPRRPPLAVSPRHVGPARLQLHRSPVTVSPSRVDARPPAAVPVAARSPRPRSRPPLEPLDAGTRAPRPRTRWGRRPTAPNPTSARRSRETEEHLRLWEGRSLSFG